MEKSMSRGRMGLYIVLFLLSLDCSLAQVQKCLVNDSDKMACGNLTISKSDCEANNCCFDPSGQNRCYYGNEVTVQCTRDGQFVVVVSRNATSPQLSLDSVSLQGGRSAPCGPVGTTAGFAMFQFPVSACGTSMKIEGGAVVYENMMSSTSAVIGGPAGSITRDSFYKLFFQCRYADDDLVPVRAVVYTVSPPLPAVSPGPLRVELRIARGELYDSYYSDLDYPVTKVLRDPVYVEVHILSRTDPNIVLTLGDCWATSTPSPLGQPSWSLLVAGCPYGGDNYQTTLIPVGGSSGLPYPTHYQRFMIQMFTFVDPASQVPLMEKVFIHCSAAVCQPTATDRCVPTCGRRRRAVARVAEDSSRETVLVSSGEVILVGSELPALGQLDSHPEVLCDAAQWRARANVQSGIRRKGVAFLDSPLLPRQQKQQVIRAVSAQCGESTIVVQVKTDLFGTGQLINASDLSLGDCAVTRQDTAAQLLIFEAELQACRSVLSTVDEQLVYSFSLNYTPKPLANTPIVRTNGAVVGIECHYMR
ncbi:zona pellucida sperm-binding protein 4-like [Lepisosteus oculatus]|uniref:zona pellucida sperm-binding protein 4-like n=1 Tax=Lepisosteus oculatus TaxID=7918 RepID=UPI003720AF96